jgi:hypothetical protein
VCTTLLVNELSVWVPSSKDRIAILVGADVVPSSNYQQNANFVTLKFTQHNRQIGDQRLVGANENVKHGPAKVFHAIHPLARVRNNR